MQGPPFEGRRDPTNTLVDIAVSPAPSSLDRRLVLLLAVACGASVANLYYAQPLLDVIAGDLGVSPGTAGLLVTSSQVGYAVGLVFLVPLGDLLDRRKMVSRLLLVCAAGLAVAAVAPSFAVLAAAIGVIGVMSVVAQVLVPLAGSLAAQKPIPSTTGTLPTHTPQFIGMLTVVTVVLTALTYFPVLALAPLAEGLS